MSTTTESCGCKHDGQRWLFTCKPHEAEWQGKHAAAAARVSYVTEFTAADKNGAKAEPEVDWLA